MNQRQRRTAFSLLELLVVIGIIALLAGLLLPALRAVQSSGAKAREIAAARQLMVGFTAYAQDHRGAVIPGYDDIHDLPAADESGRPIVDIISGIQGPLAAARYPWRLAPYVDYDFRGLYLDRTIREAIEADTTDYHYLISLFPSFGMNSTFVGGDTSDEGLAGPPYDSFYGTFYITRLSQPRHPAELMVFTSARSNGTQVYPVGNLPDLIEGYFKVTPPYLTGDRLWADRYEPNGLASDFGFVSLRDSRHAVMGFFDGHTGQLDEGEIQNMKWWADEATGPDWRLTPAP